MSETRLAPPLVMTPDLPSEFDMLHYRPIPRTVKVGIGAT